MKTCYDSVIRPCPKCGGIGVVRHYYNSPQKLNFYNVKCSNSECGHVGPRGKRVRDSVAFWNRDYIEEKEAASKKNYTVQTATYEWDPNVFGNFNKNKNPNKEWVTIIENKIKELEEDIKVLEKYEDPLLKKISKKAIHLNLHSIDILKEILE